MIHMFFSYVNYLNREAELIEDLILFSYPQIYYEAIYIYTYICVCMLFIQ